MPTSSEETLALPPHASWSEQNEQILLEPFIYLTSNPGKNIRNHLIAAFNLWLNVAPEQLTIISNVVNMLHNASLLIDDIEDSSELRRGKPVAHAVYGVAQTINTANYVYFLAYNELLKFRGDQVTSSYSIDAIVTEELLALHRGQGLEIFWRESFTCPTEEEYMTMVRQKTGGLLRIGIRLMMHLATENTNVNYVPLVDLIGIFFQIRDDLLNLDSDEYTNLKKGIADDLTEGKFSFPIIHGIRTDPHNRQILSMSSFVLPRIQADTPYDADILRQRPTDNQLKMHVIQYLRNKTHSFAYTRSFLQTLECKICQEIERLGGNIMLERIIDLLRAV